MVALTLAYGRGGACDTAKFHDRGGKGQAFLLRKDKTSYGKNISLPTPGRIATFLFRPGYPNHVEGQPSPLRFP